MKNGNMGADSSSSLILYLGVMSGLVGGVVWFFLDTLTRGAAVGPAFFADIMLKLTFLTLPFAFYSAAGLALGLFFSLLQVSFSRKGDSVFLSTLPPYFPLFLLWTATLVLCGLIGWERNNLKLGSPNGPFFMAGIIGLSFLPIYFTLMLGMLSWKRTVTGVLTLLLFGAPLIVSLYSLRPERGALTVPAMESEAGDSTKSRNDRTNILLFTIDTMRRDHLGCYGNLDIETPSIDRLAREGVLFNHCVAQAPITLPSHSSILTGLYPTTHGVRDNGYYRLDDSVMSVAELLRDEGYLTSAFVSAFPLDASFGLDQGFDLYDDRLIDRNAFFFSRVADFYTLSGVMEAMGIYHPVVIAERKAEETVGHVLDWLDAIDNVPFFLWVHLFDPHNPLNPPEDFETIYADDELRERVGTKEQRELIRSTRDFTSYAADAPEALYMKSLYKAEVTYTDYHVGRVIDRLDELDLSDRTLVILTADHGQSLFEHDYIGHSAALYGQTIDVPLIFRHPHLLPSGVEVNGLVQSVDIVPTLLELLGMGGMEDSQGNSLKEMIWGEEGSGTDRTAYFETLHSTKAEERFRGVITGGWKLIRSEDGSTRKLYHIADDPEELFDLSSEEKKRMEEMEDILDRLLAVLEVDDQEEQRLDVDSNTREILKSLGYVW